MFCLTRLLLDGERWNCIDEVPVQIQEIVAALEDGGTGRVLSTVRLQSCIFCHRHR